MARDLAGTVFPVGEAVILGMARKHQIGRKMGRTIIFSLDDCQKLYEVLPCPSGSFAAPNRPIGSSAALSAESALKKALALVISGLPKKSGQSARHKSLPESVYGRRATATFAEAAVSYLEADGDKKFLEPVIRYFGPPLWPKSTSTLSIMALANSTRWSPLQPVIANFIRPHQQC